YLIGFAPVKGHPEGDTAGAAVQAGGVAHFIAFLIRFGCDFLRLSPSGAQEGKEKITGSGPAMRPAPRRPFGLLFGNICRLHGYPDVRFFPSRRYGPAPTRSHR